MGVVGGKTVTSPQVEKCTLCRSSPLLRIGVLFLCVKCDVLEIAQMRANNKHVL